MINLNHLNHLIQQFNLGDHIISKERVYGGLLNLMYRIDTDKSSYAIKELNKNIDLNDQKIIDNYNLTENIARQFADNGIPAISAFEINDKSLSIIDNIGYLIYSWTDAKSITGDDITKHHIQTIATIIAKIHKINLNISEIDASQFDINPSSYVISIINKAIQTNLPFISDLLRYKDILVDINDKYENSMYHLAKEHVISHGDLDPKNVLWTEDNNPILIRLGVCKSNESNI